MTWMSLARGSRTLDECLRVLKKIEKKREKDVRDVSGLRFFSCLRRS